MDERQIRQIAKMIFQMMIDKQIVSDIGTSALPIAYVLLSERWQEYDSNLFNDIIDSLKEKYQCVLVLPEGNDKDRLSQAVNCNIVTRDDVAEPVEGSVSFFPIPCRDLISKTALCLSDDFNSHWVRMCIERGTAVYIRKETNMFTGKESKIYQKKVLSFYEEVESYGIHFLEDNNEMELILQKSNGSERIQNKTKKYITMADLDNVDITKVFRIQEGDMFTALAKEHIEELGIRVIVE